MCRDLELLIMANKHFFKPLLPGFHSYLTIPEAFFVKYIEGRNEQTVAKLTSDVSKIIWEVKIEDDGKKLTDGWREFALAHDLRVGDITIFRQDGDMDFHVTLLGPSCCEIQYGSCSDDQNNLEKIQRKKTKEKEAEASSLDPSCFVAKVSHASLHYDTLSLPRSFSRANGLDTRIGDVVLMNKEGKSWTLDFKRKKHCGTAYIQGGWRIFCRANGLKAGDSYTFKLIRRRGIRLLSEEEESSEGDDEIESLSTESESNQNEISFKKCRSRWKPSSSQSQNRFVTWTLTPNTLKKSIMFLPVQFTRTHGINEETTMTLMDKSGVKWSTDVRGEEMGDRIRLIRGWKECFKANSVKIGESVKLELIWEEDTSCVLMLCSIVKPNTE